MNLEILQDRARHEGYVLVETSQSIEPKFDKFGECDLMVVTEYHYNNDKGAFVGTIVECAPMDDYKGRPDAEWQAMDYSDC